MIQSPLLIITPFRNEEGSIAKTIDSIIRQTLKPCVWMFIDDNSTDRSPEIVMGYSKSFPFIQYHRLDSVNNSRATGGNVVRVFNYGLEVAAKLKVDWKFVGKMDADLVIDNNNYLEFILNKFEQYPELGIASGVTYIIDKEGRRKIESAHKWHTQGQTKFYRKECLQTMGGLKPFKGWDGLDDILARSKGFVTEKFFEQPVWHLYPTQTRSSEGGVKTGLEREALGYFNLGYPFYMYFFKAVKLRRTIGFYNSLFFLFAGLKMKLNKKPLISKDEKKVVSKFMRDRFLKRLKYTDENI